MRRLKLLIATFSLVCLANTVQAAELDVTPTNLQGWQTQVTESVPGPPGPSVQFVNGPAMPPCGGGSAQLSVGPDGADAAQLRHPGFHMTPLSSLTELEYATYVSMDGSGGQAPYLILQVDTDGDAGVEDLLFFEPLYQSAAFFPTNPQGPLVVNMWQTWDALNGGWYSVFGTAGSGPGTNVKSFSTLIAALPMGSRIINSSPSGLGGVRIVTGFGAGAWNNFVGNADCFTIGVGMTSTTYDFELRALINFTISHASVTGGGRVQGVVTLDAAAPMGGQMVHIESDNNAAVPDQDVTVPEGQTSFAFVIMANPVPQNVTVNLTAFIGTAPGITRSLLVKASYIYRLFFFPNPTNRFQNTNLHALFTGPVPPGTILQLTSTNQMVFPNQNLPVPAGAMTFTHMFVPVNAGATTVTGTLIFPMTPPSGKTASGGLTVNP
jgi:hypothetical protein